ncbi:glycosyltransferase family 2 protein [Enterococcus sp. HY326]|uniref:glycosyltransferase family 2 protein n=1 Tax=Enterococcus sp. HY326 TaxID=2971265 RepID=UPI00223EEFFF|nr:glycosyltransferase family 2 protein [Enterococcus sp. HY326]
MYKNKSQKAPWLHLVLLATVILLTVAILPMIIGDWYASNNYAHGTAIKVCLIINSIILFYFWLNGFKDVFYVVFFYLKKKKFKRIEEQCYKDDEVNNFVSDKKRQPIVLLLYCTCNDFMPDALYQSMQQDYHNFKTIILDDSSDEEYQKAIDEFSLVHKVSVIRRKDRTGFKAENINNYLKDKEDYDYFVILDSDEIIPPNFIQDTLKVSLNYQDVGIVQARHISTRNENFFMQLFARSVKANWPTYLQTKQFYGFQFFFGHGALISKACYQASGGFPALVAEDLSFSLSARIKGYYTVYADLVECQEQFPVDYYAFKKRHSKWIQGNLEFLKTKAGTIFFSPLKWYEKFDLVLFTFNLPLMAVFTLYLLMNIIAFPLLNFSPHYDLWVLVPTILVFLAPTLNDIAYFARVRFIFHFLVYWFASFLMYGSLFFLSVTTYVKSLFVAKAKFIVTPKIAKDLTMMDALWLSKGELMYGIALSLTSLFFTHSLIPVILIIIPAFSSPFLFLFHKRKNTKVMVIQKHLLANQDQDLKTIVESIPFEENQLLMDTSKVIVVEENKVVSSFFIDEKTASSTTDEVYLKVDEQGSNMKKIRYPLHTTKISWADISDFY